jgi:hypothetical protein
MIKKTKFQIDSELLSEAQKQIPNFSGKLRLNDPTDSFFHDPWIIKNEFKNTIWQKILESLEISHGEARLITLEPEQCYSSHADIDDRFHLNITGNNCFLIDIDNQIMHLLVTNGIWYTMDAGRRHSAVNFGTIPRIQLVVRHLLPKNKLNDPRTIEIRNNKLPKSRYNFDDILSPFLHSCVRNQIITNVKLLEEGISFEYEKSHIDILKELASYAGIDIHEY